MLKLFRKSLVFLSFICVFGQVDCKSWACVNEVEEWHREGIWSDNYGGGQPGFSEDVEKKWKASVDGHKGLDINYQKTKWAEAGASIAKRYTKELFRSNGQKTSQKIYTSKLAHKPIRVHTLLDEISFAGYSFYADKYSENFQDSNVSTFIKCLPIEQVNGQNTRVLHSTWLQSKGFSDATPFITVLQNGTFTFHLLKDERANQPQVSLAQLGLNYTD